MMQGDMFGDNQEIITNKLKAETMQKAANGGCKCPVCEQTVKIYRRRINSNIARALIAMYRQHGVGAWFHIRDVGRSYSTAGEFAFLRFYGLIEKKEHTEGDEGKKSSGYWKLTDLAGKFVRKEVLLSKYIKLYNGACLGFEGGDISIEACLQNKFDYNDLMKGI